MSDESATPAPIDPWPLLADYFKARPASSSLQIDSFNHFTTHALPQLISGTVIQVPLPNDRTYIVAFGNVYIQRPAVSDGLHQTRVLYPNDARKSDLSYEAIVLVDIFTQVISTGADGVRHCVDSTTQTAVPMFRFPVMLRSSLCNLSRTRELHDECGSDHGGYFIVQGKERVLIAQERNSYNTIFIFEDKKSTKSDYVAEIRSIKEEADYSVLMRVRVVDDAIQVTLPYVQQDVPLGAVLSAMHVDPDRFLALFANQPKAYRIVLLRSLDRQWRDYDVAVRHIGKYTKNRVPESRRTAHTMHIIDNEILPHLGMYATPDERGDFLALMVLKLLRVVFGHASADDRDHVCNKRIEMTGYLIGKLCRDLFKKFLKQLQMRIEKKPDLNIVKLIQNNKITQGLYTCFKKGDWGVPKSKYIRKGVSQILNRLSSIATLSHLRRLTVPIGKESKNMQVRQLHASSYGFTCPSETPEGQTAGIIKAFSVLVRISTGFGTTLVCDTLRQLCATYVDFDTHVVGAPDAHGVGSVIRNLDGCGMFVNGAWLGMVRGNPEDAVRAMRLLRQSHYLDRNTSIQWDTMDNVVHIHSDEGRLLRPVFFVQHPQFGDLSELAARGWDWLEDTGLIVWVDGYEVDFVHVAMYACDIIDETVYLEIHPSLMFGNCAITIPFPEHSQAPRNLYSSSMMKQAMGVYATNYMQRFDNTAYVLHYPQRRMVGTRYEGLMDAEDTPSGTNCVVAIACYSGFNQEDSVLVNRAAVERGLFTSTTYKTYATSEIKRGTHGHERIELPDATFRQTAFNYDGLDERGIVRRGTVITKRHVLVGRVFYRNEMPHRDRSLMYDGLESGVVDGICETTNVHGYRLIKVRIRYVRQLEMGDKVASTQGQKGTTGILLPQEDMPFTADGIVPDVVINAHCIPSRMTINMLLEQLCGKACAFTGKFQDATAFCHNGEDLIADMGTHLTDNGFDRHGEEWFCNGMTGVPLKMTVFVGIAYYQRLKHLVADKIHARATGKMQALTRQPVEGRSRQGGGRVGHMESDAMLSHGASIFLKEKLFDNSDPFAVDVCAACGFMLNSATDLCPMCDADQTKHVAIPYAGKLLFQLLTALGIKIRMS